MEKKSRLSTGSATEPIDHTDSVTERLTNKGMESDSTERLDSKRKGKEEESDETERVHSFSDRTLSVHLGMCKDGWRNWANRICRK